MALANETFFGDEPGPVAASLTYGPRILLLSCWPSIDRGRGYRVIHFEKSDILPGPIGAELASK